MRTFAVIFPLGILGTIFQGILIQLLGVPICCSIYKDGRNLWFYDNPSIHPDDLQWAIQSYLARQYRRVVAHREYVLLAEMFNEQVSILMDERNNLISVYGSTDLLLRAT